MGYKNDKYIVYMHISPSNKKYIGITHQKPSLRWRSKGQGYKSNPVFYAAIQKYGWENFTHLILLHDLTYEEACEKEKSLIKLYDTLVPHGYNVDEGGYQGTCFKRSIIAFNEDKRCLKFDSITDAADYVGVIPSSISHVIGTPRKVGGWFYIYAN